MAKDVRGVPAFRDIVFGYAAAEKEASERPSLLLDGFYDLKAGDQEQAVTDALLRDGRFLVLGYKGAGKSAISERLRLLSTSDHSLFVSQYGLVDFSYKTFRSIMSGDAEPQARYPTAWAWLLYVCVLHSFLGDHGAPSQDDPEIMRTVRILQSMGILPARELHDLVLKSSKRSFKLALPKLLEASTEQTYEGSDLQLRVVVDHLHHLVDVFETPNRHLIILDGLDDILSGREVEYHAIESLVREASRMNARLRQTPAKPKIVLLCRTDLYEQLPGPNKNKIRQDSGIHLDWYDQPRNPRGSALVTLANERAALSTGERVRDAFETYFPDTVDGSPVVQYLLDHTRHTPRDFLQLLKFIQHYGGNGLLQESDVLSGLRKYSIEYFLPEVRDEIVGYVPLGKATAVLAMLGSRRRREFTRQELVDSVRAGDKVTAEDIDAVLSALFECSGIGTIHAPHSGRTYYTFRFRNRSATFARDERFLLHRGLWKALNVP